MFVFYASGYLKGILGVESSQIEGQFVKLEKVPEIYALFCQILSQHYLAVLQSFRKIRKTEGRRGVKVYLYNVLKNTRISPGGLPVDMAS